MTMMVMGPLVPLLALWVKLPADAPRNTYKIVPGSIAIKASAFA
eukprot:CAMPEP_0116556720 /NCGR_PEP_ID=MMETSP0397-20121206/8846_1 /TAXON_ID=216820 /ORGANISM="Cyclophora tenuis, Strain ECT3854" /LENGTH=43 /DNA_ID= /DNA_START= /DNA_END= /DNA_ORIENTATION=